MAEAEAAARLVVEVSFGEVTTVGGGLRCTPFSSAFSIGAANWRLELGADACVYVGPSSAMAKRHPAPLDVESLRGAAVLVLAANSLRPLTSVAPNEGLSRLSAALTAALSKRFRVLMPVTSSGVVYDLIDHVATLLPTGVPIAFVSPSAHESVAVAAISSQWLYTDKRDRPLRAEAPFLHTQLRESGMLKLFDSIHDPEFQALLRAGPCVVMAADASLRFGDACHLARLWATMPRSTIIMTEPLRSVDVTLLPYRPLQCEVVEAPIDPRLHLSEFANVAINLQPQALVVPSALGPTFRKGAEHLKFQLLELGNEAVLSVPFARSYERAFLDGSVAQATRMSGHSDTTGEEVFHVSASLHRRDGRLFLKPTGDAPTSASASVIGSAIDRSVVAARLQEVGFSVLEVSLPDGVGARLDLGAVGHVDVFSDRTVIRIDDAGARKVAADVVLGAVTL